MNQELFDLIRTNYALVSRLDLADIKSRYWKELLSRGRQGSGGKGDFIDHPELWVNFRNNVITKGLDNANVPPDALESVLPRWRRMYSLLKGEIPREYRQYLEEVQVGNPQTISIDGINVSQSSMEYTYMLTHLAPYLESSNVVVDIGAGYGGFDRTLKKAFPSQKYILLDLPETNAIQTYFLRQCFPEMKFAYAQDVAELALLDPAALDFDFLILPGQFIAKLRPSSVDVFINTRSMMEMDPDTVSFYVEHIEDKLRPGGRFYCLNRYAKKTRLKDYPFDERWYVAYSEPWPRFIDENPHHELIAVRTAFPVKNGLRALLRTFPPSDSRVLEKLRQLAHLQPPPALSLENKILRTAHKVWRRLSHWTR
ncbi:MAG: putative sugar O-methyltransferase, partial [Acidobacteriota bacterium]